LEQEEVSEALAARGAGQSRQTTQSRPTSALLNFIRSISVAAAGCSVDFSETCLGCNPPIAAEALLVNKQPRP